MFESEEEKQCFFKQYSLSVGTEEKQQEEDDALKTNEERLKNKSY